MAINETAVTRLETAIKVGHGGQGVAGWLVTEYERLLGQQSQPRRAWKALPPGNEKEITDFAWDLFYALRDDGDTIAALLARAEDADDAVATAGLGYMVRHADTLADYLERHRDADA